MAQVGPLKEPGKGRGATGGVRQSARDLGIPRPSLERSLKVAALPRETKTRAVELGLGDNQAALLKATKAAGSARRDLLALGQPALDLLADRVVGAGGGQREEGLTRKSIEPDSLLRVQVLVDMNEAVGLRLGKV